MADPFSVTAPFDHAKADIILRSSDGVDFRVFKLFLSLASPFFETLFDIPQPAKASEDQEIEDGLVVIPVAEHSKTLDALLRFCYPCTLAEDPKLDVLEDALDVLEAARKYSLDVIEKKARQTISSPTFLEAEPLRCFAIAHRGRLHEETLLAAKYTLTRPLIPSWFREIELITSADLLALLTYHQKCGEAVYALRADLSWITSHYGSHEACAWLVGRVPSGSSAQTVPGVAFGMHHHTNRQGSRNYEDCACPSTLTSRYRLFNNRSLQWWEDFMEETFIALRDKPCGSTVQATAEKTIQTVKASNCGACSSVVTSGMHDFLELFVRKIEEVVAQIELQLEF